MGFQKRNRDRHVSDRILVRRRHAAEDHVAAVDLLLDGETDIQIFGLQEYAVGLRWRSENQTHGGRTYLDDRRDDPIAVTGE